MMGSPVCKLKRLRPPQFLGHRRGPNKQAAGGTYVKAIITLLAVIAIGTLNVSA
jgi:hypothetical protein